MRDAYAKEVIALLKSLRYAGWLGVLLVWLVLIAIAVTGCDSVVAPCEIRTQIVEEEVNFDFPDHIPMPIALMQRGWDCDPEGPVRNAFGTIIAYRYRCTICT